MNHRLLLFCVGAAAFATAFHPATAQATPWSFGVISDTQWLVTDDGKNPNTIAANIIKQVDSQFIAANVKLVVAIGDMTDSGSQANDYVRALYAQDLYNAGIGFYPTRGNHEAANGTYIGSGADFRHVYPQIVPGVNAGINNSTPGDITTALVSPAGDLTNNPPASATGSPFPVGNGFTSPTAANLANDSISYAFNYDNVTFMLLDQFQSPDYYTSHIPEQMDWINSTLAGRPANTHAFVFTHKNMLGGNHKDSMFGGQVTSADPGDCSSLNYASLTAANQTAFTAKTNFINSFLGAMQGNHVKYVISGHDHHHYNSIVTSPDQQSKTHQLICASDSSKFYTPGNPASTNDLPVEQQLNRIGYYIFTVDGPRVTIDYYADTTASNYSGPFHFVKQSTTGYSLNGQEFVIPEGAVYTSVSDNTTAASTNGETGYVGTSMGILNGSNTSVTTNNYGKAQAKAVNTGWTPSVSGLASDVLSVWGLQQIGAAQADTYTLALSYDPSSVSAAQLANGSFVLAGKDSFGHWVNAVDLNKGGVRRFVSGAYTSSYPLGTFGVDSASHTVWAVVNHQGDFAAKALNEVVNFIYTSDNHYGIVRPIFRGNFNVTGQAVNEAMIARMNTLPTQSFPNDSGVAAGQPIGQVDFLMDTGDIANRSESSSAIAANHSLSYLGSTLDYPGQASYVAPVSSVTWGQWQHDFLGDANPGNTAGGLLTLTNSQGQGIPVFLSPGNHDVSDAIGMIGKIATGDRDATSFVQIYNRMTPYSGKSPIATSVFTNPADYTNVNLQVNYSFDVGGTHVMCVNLFPDKNILNWMTADLANVAASTPVLLFCHAPLNMAAGETKVFGNPSTTSSSAAGDIPFALTGTDSSTSYVDMNAAKQYVADWLIAHPSVRALFSGHDNFNGATNWNGQDPNNNLIATRDAAWPGVELFRVDSPMKGDYSGVSATTAPLTGIGDETKLSFQVYSYDIATRRLTEREFLWNPNADASGTGAWSGQSVTLDLSLSPTTAATLAGPANGSSVTDGPPTLTWSTVYGATGYTVAVTGPGGTVSCDVAGTSLSLALPLANGLYTWTVKANNIEGSGPVSATGNFTLLLPPTLTISGPDGNGNMHVTWPISAPGYQLQFSPDMNNWVPVTGSGFFRLVKP